MPSDKARQARSMRAEDTGAGAEAMTALDAEALSRFLSELARRVRENPPLARELGAALVASGLLGSGDGARAGHSANGGTVEAVQANDLAKGPAARRTRQSSARSVSRSPGVRGGNEASLPDPFALLRAGGVEAVREGLSQYDSYDLQRIIRTHRLDPARISARWTARERLLSLILDQVRARANHGRAFERV